MFRGLEVACHDVVRPLNEANHEEHLGNNDEGNDARSQVERGAAEKPDLESDGKRKGDGPQCDVETEISKDHVCRAFGRARHA